MCSDYDSAGLSIISGVGLCYYKRRERGNGKNYFKLEYTRYYITREDSYDTGRKHTLFMSTTHVHREQSGWYDMSERFKNILMKLSFLSAAFQTIKVKKSRNFRNIYVRFGKKTRALTLSVFFFSWQHFLDLADIFFCWKLHTTHGCGTRRVQWDVTQWAALCTLPF